LIGTYNLFLQPIRSQTHFKKKKTRISLQIKITECQLPADYQQQMLYQTSQIISFIIC